MFPLEVARTFLGSHLSWLEWAPPVWLQLERDNDKINESHFPLCSLVLYTFSWLHG